MGAFALLYLIFATPLAILSCIFPFIAAKDDYNSEVGMSSTWLDEPPHENYWEREERLEREREEAHKEYLAKKIESDNDYKMAA